MLGPYQGKYTFPVASTVERSMQQAANAQAQMFAGLGNEFKEGIDKYFQGKEEKEMATSMAENPIALEVVYGNQGTVPTDPAERIKDIRGVMRASGGFENFIKRMENFELKQQNKTVIEQNMALKNLQMKTIEDAQREREKTRATTEEFARFLTTPRPGQLTPKGRELEATLGRFEPSEVPGTPEFEALEISEPMGARPNIGAAAFKSSMEKERSPDRPAPMLEPSNRFMQSASEAGLSPEAGLKAYAIAQEKAKTEATQGAASLARQIAVNKEMRDQGKDVRDWDTFSEDMKLQTFDNLKLRDIGPNNSSVEVKLQGRLPNTQAALKLRGDIGEFNDVQDKLDELLKFAEIRKNKKWSMMSENDKDMATRLAKMVQAGMRTEVLGPGAVTEAEYAILNLIVSNPSKFWTGNVDAGIQLRALKRMASDSFKKKLVALGITTAGAGSEVGTTSTADESGPTLPSDITGVTVEEI